MYNISITAIVLAGGKGRRMGLVNKGLMVLDGKPLYLHVIDRVYPQVEHIIVNANDNIEQYEQSGFMVVNDSISGYLGPLAGIYAGLVNSNTDWNLIVSCDVPFLPDDLVRRLINQVDDNDAAYVFDGEKHHPTIMLIHKRVLPTIKNQLEHKELKLMTFLSLIKSLAIDFSDNKSAFVNINTPEELSLYDLHNQL